MARDQVTLTHVYGERMNSKILYPALVVAWLVAAGFTTPPPLDGDVGGSVADSATSTPLPGGEVRILRGGNTIATTTTDAFGRYVIHNVPAGSYSVEVRYLGYRSEARNVAIGATDALARADFRLVPLPINLSAVEVSSAVPLAVDTRTGNQIFKQNDYHGAPTNTTSQILQQSIVGAARAPTGEVHIRGQHAEYTYYVDAVPVSTFHNDGTDLFGFGKLQYGPTDHDVVNLDVNRTRTRFAVPFDSVEGIIDDHQQDVNGFVNLGWRHRFAESSSESGRSAELFTGAFFRDGSLNYTPGLSDDPTFVFAPDTTHYILTEDRNFHTVGLKLDYTLQPHHGLELKTGVLASLTRGHEDFSSVTSTGNLGPASNSDLKGSDFGVYAQTAIAPSDKWELRTGVRFDNHNAPFAGNQHQVSPRVKLSFFPDPGNTFWVYYGRFFLPTNVEDLRAITSDAQGGVVAAPTLPERDDFYEVGYVHRFPVGIVTKLSAYHKRSSPGIDDNTVPGSAIVTSVNIDQVRITGIEGVVEIRPSGPVSAYVNVALNHAYGYGAITGGFFPAVPPSGTFDLDHDQRLSGVASVVYSSHGFYLSTTGVYGSGLTNGADPDATYGTGLLDFNQSIKVPSSFILNASAGYAFAAGGVVLRPQIYVENAFDKQYLLKGAFFSGASFGRPRSIQLRMNIGA